MVVTVQLALSLDAFFIKRMAGLILFTAPRDFPFDCLPGLTRFLLPAQMFHTNDPEYSESRA